MKGIFYLLSSLVFVLLSVAPLQAQSKEEQKEEQKDEQKEKEKEEDKEEYYQSFQHLITTRFYFSRKFTRFRINDHAENVRYSYRPNSSLNMGIGATYSWASLNLAYGFPFLNQDQGLTNTRYLDLQAHAYPEKFVVDIFAQFYKGYTLDQEGIVSDEKKLYLRPDLVTTELGASFQYLFNYDKFSFRAASLQNEWQKKSAGSFLLGFEAYAGRAKGDSSLIPNITLDQFTRNFERTRFIEFGPNAGAAYSLIIKKHFFITGAISTSLTTGYSVQDGDYYREEQWGIKPNLFWRLFAGYNSSRWSINAHYLVNNVRVVSERQFSNALLTGNYRLNFVYRFNTTPGLRKYLKKLRLDPEVEEDIQAP